MKSLPGQQLLKAYRPGFRAGQSSVYRTRLELKLVQSKSKGAVPQLGISGCRVHAYAFSKSSNMIPTQVSNENKKHLLGLSDRSPKFI